MSVTFSQVYDVLEQMKSASDNHHVRKGYTQTQRALGILVNDQDRGWEGDITLVSARSLRAHKDPETGRRLDQRIGSVSQKRIRTILRIHFQTEMAK